MVYLFILLWLWWSQPNSLIQISENNRARREAEAAYQAGNYGRALSLYAALSRTTTTIDPAVRLNLGHTYFQLKRYDKARPQYETLLRSDRPDLRTVAATQLGVMACLQGDSAAALLLFEQALLEDPNNEPARYDFELIKKQFSGKLPDPNQRQKSAKSRSASQSRPVGQQVEQSARQDELLRRFRRLNLSEEQAIQLLDAMQDDDLPYALTRSARRSNAKSTSRSNHW
ncbi:tetratricopeptide repeat protein [Spirosoma taeanense]|uniref:Tetratricopeptide repeat protein n=1 Tax=Spirosoma taeanense TaxID=2735870 RepID=A0A6M5YCT6_9BACT|nr:tetratricopeptide repeat protein [Spirosoma taeanense]QJW90772.1 tetratricopeptide repeat protein [Spirosoma taeanense]